MNQPPEAAAAELSYLKQVSRIKHRILAEYLRPWTVILGKNSKRLGYIDCFAGNGIYRDENNEPLPGSPVIALDLAAKYASEQPDHSLLLVFVEKNRATAERLKEALSEIDVPESVKYLVAEERAQDYIQQVISSIGESKTGRDYSNLLIR